MFVIRLSLVDVTYAISIRSEDYAYTIFYSIKLSKDLPLKQLLFYPTLDSQCGQILSCESYK